MKKIFGIIILSLLVSVSCTQTGTTYGQKDYFKENAQKEKANQNSKCMENSGKKLGSFECRNIDATTDGF